MAVPRSIEDNPVAVQLYGDARSGNRAAVAAFLRNLTERADWDAKSYYVGVVTDAVDDARPLWITAWQAAAPEEADAWTVGGAHAVAWAWNARGGGWGNTVSKESFAVFHRRLVLAEEQLARAARLAPGDPTPWAEMLPAGMGLGVPRAVEAERFRKVVAIAPEHEDAHGSYLQYLCDKWHGSHDEMFGFARAASLSAPDGSAVHTLIIRAHVERHIRIGTSTARGRQERAFYFDNPSIRAEIMGAAQRCILSPHYVAGRTTNRHRSLFAFAFMQIGQSALARTQFELMGEHFAETPWNYYGRAVQQVATARRALGMPELAVTANEATALLAPARTNNDDDDDDDDNGGNNNNAQARSGDDDEDCSSCTIL